MANSLSSYNFWRLFHCLLSHSSTEEESTRCKAVFTWMGDHLTTLRKISVGHELELIGVVWKLASTNSHLPGVNLLRESVQAMDNCEGPVEALNEYKEFAPGLTVHAATDMEAVLKDACSDFETAIVSNMLRIANTICDGSMDIGKKKYSGPADALKYLHQRQERGLLVKPNQILRPINVNKEAATIGEWYDESLNTHFLPTGLFDNQSGREVLLETSSFVGILGYLHDGKSPVARHLLYTMAAAGWDPLESTCRHASLSIL